MNELLKTKMFRLLSDASQVTNEEMQSAYDDFVEQTAKLNQPETECSKAFRILNLTRIEFETFKLTPLYGQGKKCLEISLSTKNYSVS